jgi:UDP-N-acetylmuramate--alanine ligase
MDEAKSYFFCGIGGSGMLPLALIVQGRGHRVAGSDRTLDQGRLSKKFEFLKQRGISLYPQDGSGLTGPDQILVTSAAVEETVPDVVRAKALGLERVSRPELLGKLFNDAKNGVAVGGTSGKSTVTGMIGWILHALGRDPTVMNGAVMKNFAGPDVPFASALVGQGDLFVSEVDESDGSINLYKPKVAVLNNITLDHKSLEELRHLFRDFALKAETIVLNLDDDETRLLAAVLPGERIRTCSFRDSSADLFGTDIEEQPFAISFTLRSGSACLPVRLGVPGRHNAENALVALASVQACGVELEEAVQAIGDFSGLRRRLEWIGEARGISVIDDFGHNPDKIRATLRTLHAFPGRLLIFFQPHGYGPLRVMKDELVATFMQEMNDEDVLLMPDPVYFGGTTNREIGSREIIATVGALGRNTEHFPDRKDCGDRLIELARPGDRIVVMGARDDSLTQFAEDLLGRLG